MLDAIIIVAGINCNKTKMGGWGFIVYEIEKQTKYKLTERVAKSNLLFDNYYLSSYGVNRQWTLANEGDDTFNVLEVSELYEIFGSTKEPSSLAKAESNGFLEALKFISDKNYKDILVCCDSRYIAQNLQKLLKDLDSEILRRKDGNIISTYDHWSEIVRLILKLNADKVNLKWSWVRDYLPKDLVEYSKILAKKGQALTFNKQDKIEEHYPFGKKKVPQNRIHGFFLQSKMYFIPNIINVTATGERYYFCGNHGSNDEWCGKPKSDSSISVFIMKELDPVIELVTKIKRDYSPNAKGQIIRLNNIKTASVRNEIITHHKNLMLFDSTNGDLYDYAGRLLVLEQNPPFLFFKLYEELESLYEKLNTFMMNKKDENVFYIDITDRIYDTVRNRKVVSSDLKNNKYVDIKIPRLDVTVTLTLKIELITDLGLSRIAPENPVVRLYIERVGPILYKYYVYIQTSKATGLFTATDANSIFLPPKND